MNNKTFWLRVMTVAGVMIVWSPLVLMLLTGIPRLFRSGMLQFDYLLPAELFPLLLIGGLLLLAVSLSQKLERRLVGLGMLIPVASLLLLILFANVSGMDKSPTSPTGFQMAMIAFFMIAYTAGVGLLGVGGLRLHKQISRIPASSEIE